MSLRVMLRVPKVLLSAIGAAAVATSALLSVQAQAADVPTLYAERDSADAVSTQVYLNGNPAPGAEVKLYSSNGTLLRQKSTNKYGRANFGNIDDLGPVALTATVDGQESATSHVMMRDDRKD